MPASKTPRADKIRELFPLNIGREEISNYPFLREHRAVLLFTPDEARCLRDVSNTLGRLGNWITDVLEGATPGSENLIRDMWEMSQNIEQMERIKFASVPLMDEEAKAAIMFPGNAEPAVDIFTTLWQQIPTDERRQIHKLGDGGAFAWQSLYSGLPRYRDDRLVLGYASTADTCRSFRNVLELSKMALRWVTEHIEGRQKEHYRGLIGDLGDIKSKRDAMSRLELISVPESSDAIPECLEDYWQKVEDAAAQIER